MNTLAFFYLAMSFGTGSGKPINDLEGRTRIRNDLIGRIRIHESIRICNTAMKATRKIDSYGTRFETISFFSGKEEKIFTVKQQRWKIF